MQKTKALYIALCLVVLACIPVARADCTNPAGAEGQVTYNEQYHVPQVCAGTQWMAMGELNPAAGGPGCSTPSGTAPEGTMLYNKDYHVLQYCDGDDWIATHGSSASGFLGFTDLTDQPTSTQVSSNILQAVAGGSISISGDGSPQYRICADADCNTENHTWSSSAGSIDDGQYLQLRLTSNAAASTMNSATVTVGASNDRWDVTTAAGACGGSPSPGDLCSDGSYYIGDIGAGKVYATAAASESSQTWNNGTFDPPWTATGFTSTTDGLGNTAGLVALSDAGSPYDAAEYCVGLSNVHGHSDWYLPAQDELNLFWNGGTPVAGVNTSGSWYWSSSEVSSSHARNQRFNDGSQTNSNKTNSGRLIRCVRR